MRKLLVVLALAALAVSSSGCCGRIRNLFHRGAPCGTRAVGPGVLGAPITLGQPLAGRVIGGAPCCPDACCPDDCGVPCDAACGCECSDCYNGASSGWSSSGYYVGESSGCSSCGDGGIVEGQVTSGPIYDGSYGAPMAPTEVPAAGGGAPGTYRDPGPVREN
jgi:hypothetical protein